MTDRKEIVSASRIRDVDVEYLEVRIAGHIVEQHLSYDISEAEARYGRPWDEELDRHIQLGMFAIDRISADGTIHKVAAAKSYILDGRCCRSVKIASCGEVALGSYYWRSQRPDGTTIRTVSRQADGVLWSVRVTTLPDGTAEEEIYSCSDESPASAHPQT